MDPTGSEELNVLLYGLTVIIRERKYLIHRGTKQGTIQKENQ
jgi:hypothetical protein